MRRKVPVSVSDSCTVQLEKRFPMEIVTYGFTTEFKRSFILP